MSKLNVIAVFDVGKTNKKLFLFDEGYKIVYEKTARFTETVDEDGYSCENLESLRLSIFESLAEVFRLNKYRIRAINFSTYGASLVYIDEAGNPLTPLYNYLKPYPPALEEQFYEAYGGREAFCNATASPALGSLNSGLQIYRFKHQQPEVFAKVKYALHLPQYLSYLLTGRACSDITSIGCHTALWDYEAKAYHQWVKAEGIDKLLSPIASALNTYPSRFPGNEYSIGIGLHDSSAALIPYLVSFNEPFVLLSTGTWSISLNPFNQESLTAHELQNDCLNYMQYKGKPVKASRLFAGYILEQQVKRIAEHFGQNTAKYKTLAYNPEVVTMLEMQHEKSAMPINWRETDFPARDLSVFANDEEAYHQLIIDIVASQRISTQLVLNGTTVKRLFVDGGFTRNTVFMNLLATAFPHMEVYAASMAQATALGAALAINNSWNTGALPADLIELKYYAHNQTVTA